MPAASPHFSVSHLTEYIKALLEEDVRLSNLEVEGEISNLTYHRSEVSNEPLEFTFFHFLETLDDVVVGDGNIEDCLTTVTYHPVAFEEHIASRNVFTELQEDAANNCNKTFSKTEYEEYHAVLDIHGFPDTQDSDELIDSEFGRTMIDRLEAAEPAA